MSGAPAIRERVRRFASLRVAQRVLSLTSSSRVALEPALLEGRALLDRLRRLDADDGGAAAELAEIDDLLDAFSARFHGALARTPVRELCVALRRAGDDDPSAVRGLGAALLEGDLQNDATLRLVEAAVTSLACAGEPGARRVRHAPEDALPELARLEPADVSADEVKQAQEIFSRAIERLDQDDPGAARTRMRRYKERLAGKLLHAEILASAVAYNAAMANRISGLAPGAGERDALTETLLGGESPAVSGATGARHPGRSPALRSRLLWTSAATAALALACLALATSFWPAGSGVRGLSPERLAALSPILASGYVTESDGRALFVGTVAAGWSALDRAARERVVAEVVAGLGEAGVRDVFLVDARRAPQARHDGRALLWLKEPAPASPGGGPPPPPRSSP